MIGYRSTFLKKYCGGSFKEFYGGSMNMASPNIINMINSFSVPELWNSAVKEVVDQFLSWWNDNG